MCNPALAVIGVSAIVGASSARNAAKGQQASLLTDANASDRNAIAADNAAKVSANNAEIANWQARDAIRTGESAVGNVMDDRSAALAASNNEAATVKSKQKVGFAANGVDIGQGSAADVQTSTDYVRELNNSAITDAANQNAATIRDNAIKNAWGYRTQGVNYQETAAAQRADANLYRFDARQQRAGASNISPSSAAAVSLLGSAGQVASAWYAGSKKG